MFRVLLQGRPAAWGKVDALREAMEDDRWDWVAWIDCDLYFMDMNRTLDSLLLTHARAAGEAASIDESVHMLVTEDAQSLNTAILLMRRSAWSRRLLARDSGQHVIFPFFSACKPGGALGCSRCGRCSACLGMGR